jgi:hypothetical protein
MSAKGPPADLSQADAARSEPLLAAADEVIE